MELYANNLEQLVEERTADYLESNGMPLDLFGSHSIHPNLLDGFT
jgi:hypothetical protein